MSRATIPLRAIAGATRSRPGERDLPEIKNSVFDAKNEFFDHKRAEIEGLMLPVS
jgi:hypothetical protein